MRKVLLFSGILISILSCQKGSDNEGGSSNKTFCWKCVTNVTVSTPGYPSQTSTATTSYCDRTEAEAKQIAQSGTMTSTATSMGVTMTTTSKTTCSKK
jgi:hypothetical protein